MTIGEFIQYSRKKAGLTQKELGDKLGLSGSMIGQWENNLRNPKPETLKKLNDALDGALAEYFLKNRDKIGFSAAIGIDSSDIIEIGPVESLLAYEDLSPKDKAEWAPVNQWNKKMLERSLNLTENDEKRLAEIERYYKRLNEDGREEAVERIRELTLRDKYTK